MSNEERTKESEKYTKLLEVHESMKAANVSHISSKAL